MTLNKKFFPVYQPMLDNNERVLVQNCIKENWISSKGKYIEKFEKSFSKKFGYRFSTAVSNGTVALHLALLALGIKKGDEVIIPSMTFVAVANAVTYVGAKPIFAVLPVVASLLRTKRKVPLSLSLSMTAAIESVSLT